MARGGFPGGNMQNLMKQAQDMQKKMLQAQEEIQNKSVEATAGGGAIKVLVSGKKELKQITINPEVVDKDDVDMLQDLIMAAVNEGLRKIDEVTQSEMSKVTGGLGNLGGLF